jgi:hypothetical protein
VAGDAYAHDLFHRARLGELRDVTNVVYLHVGTPPRHVLDDCPFCGRRDLVVASSGLCPRCSDAAAA